MKTLLELYWIFLKIGSVAFGGGYAMLPILQREFVIERDWLSDEELMRYYYKEDCVSQVAYLTYLNTKEEVDVNNILILSDENIVPWDEFSPIVKGLLENGSKREKRVFYGKKSGGIK